MKMADAQDQGRRLLASLQRVLVLNGPNLGRLGSREPEKYGTASYDELVKRCERTGLELGFSVEVRQTDDVA
jgi:3-dehydroquinate dehydratase-2